MDNQTQEYYNGIANEYDTAYVPDSPNARRFDWFKNQFTAVQPHTLLDIGCGDGRLLEWCGGQGLTYRYGVEASTMMVNQARARVPSVSILHHDWFDDAVHDGLFRHCPAGFDMITAFGVLPHVEDTRRFFALIDRHLAPGGVAYVSFRNELMSLSSQNCYTTSLYRQILRGVGVDDMTRRHCSELDEQRGAANVDPAYDTLTTYFHNPLTIAQQYCPAGATMVADWFYHYHPLPPRYKAIMGSERYAALCRTFEDALCQFDQWQGVFLASAGIVTMRRGAAA